MDNMFCRYTFSYGPDWRIVQGVDHGFSQVAQKGSSADASVVWNFPLDVTFKAMNAHGWPRLVVSVYSQVRWRGRVACRRCRVRNHAGAHVLEHDLQPRSAMLTSPSCFARRTCLAATSSAAMEVC